MKTKSKLRTYLALSSSSLLAIASARTASRKPLAISAAALVALLGIPAAHAAPVTWTGLTNGTWNTGGNWSGSSVPLITDDLTILGPLNVAGALTI